mgnify:CR=1 FL=1
MSPKAAVDDDEKELGSVDTYSTDDDSTGSLADFIVDDDGDDNDGDDGFDSAAVAPNAGGAVGGTKGMSRFLQTVANIERRAVRSVRAQQQASGGAVAASKPAAKPAASTKRAVPKTAAAKVAKPTKSAKK